MSPSERSWYRHGMRWPCKATLSLISFASFAPLLALAALGTSCTTSHEATLTLSVGEETDALTKAPTPTTLIVENVSLEGDISEFSRTPLPANELALGERGRSAIGAFRVRAVDSTSTTRLKGETPFLQFGALEDVSLQILLQRTFEFARLPLSDANLDAPRVALVSGRYLLAASQTATSLYDLLLLRPGASLPPLPRPAKSLATLGTLAVVVDDQGATTLDLTQGTATDVSAPSGGSFGEVAGGGTVTAPDGSIYIVGATRAAGGPTARVMTIAPSGHIAFAALSVPRQGACAAWVEGRGLLVYGGGETGAGAEILAPGATLATALAWPTDAVTGCAATALDASHVLIAAGRRAGTESNVRVIDVACAGNCVSTAWNSILPLVHAEAFTLGVDAVLVAGDDAAGTTHVMRVTPKAFTEIPLKLPRKGARLVALPTAQTFAIVGGAPRIERYVE